jgi:hypothetical protein
MRCFDGQKYGILNLNEECYIYVIKASIPLLNHYAQKNDKSVFNMTQNYHETFRFENKDEYEPLRDSTKHETIQQIFQTEFDLDGFKSEGIVLDHFPLMNLAKTKVIKNTWKTCKRSLYTNVLSLYLKPEYMRIFMIIGDYHGTKIGFFYAFYAHYTSWLFLPSIFGVSVYIFHIIDYTWF